MSDAAPRRPRTDNALAPQKDGDILHLIAQGDMKAAFALVMARYQAKVYRLCIAYLRDPTAAQDAAQDSLVRVWRTLPRYDGRAALSTLIYVITRNRCLSALSTRAARAPLNEPLEQAELDRLSAAGTQANRDLDTTLRQLVDELAQTTRRIVILYYFEEGSIAEISALVGLPVGTIKTHLFRARRLLRARLQELGLDLAK